MVKGCQRCYKKLDETARAMGESKKLLDMQAAARRNLDDLRQIYADALRANRSGGYGGGRSSTTTALAAGSGAGSGSGSGAGEGAGGASAEIEAAARKLDNYFRTAQTAQRDVASIRELQARLWDELQQQGRHLADLRKDTHAAEVSGLEGSAQLSSVQFS